MKNHWNSTIKRKVELGYYRGVDTTLLLVHQPEEEDAGAQQDAEPAVGFARIREIDESSVYTVCSLYFSWLLIRAGQLIKQ